MCGCEKTGEGCTQLQLMTCTDSEQGCQNAANWQSDQKQSKPHINITKSKNSRALLIFERSIRMASQSESLSRTRGLLPGGFPLAAEWAT